MKFLEIAFLVFAIVSIANAGSESISIGPFNVDFWLNTSEKYNVITSEDTNNVITSGPATSGSVTEYKISVNNLRGEEKAYVAIERSEMPQIQISPNAFAVVLENELNKSNVETNSTLLMIDGHLGFLVTAKDSQNKSETYDFGYWLDDRALVSVMSTYGWDDGSKSLVNTVHISLREATTAQKQKAKDFLKEGIALFGKGKFDKAIKSFDEAIKLDPKYGEAWYFKGVVLDVWGDSIGAGDPRGSSSKKAEANAAKAKAKELGYEG